VKAVRWRKRPHLGRSVAVTEQQRLDPEERDPEAPIADAFEQTIRVDPAEEEAEEPEPVRIGLEVNESDAIEQAQVVEAVDDDYR
jgi:hypothetical protein